MALSLAFSCWLTCAKTGKLSECSRLFTPLPQLLRNVPYKGASPLKNSSVQAAIERAKKNLGSQGRVFIRESGTEPLIRVMAEGESHEQVESVVASICASLQQAA